MRFSLRRSFIYGISFLTFFPIFVLILLHTNDSNDGREESHSYGATNEVLASNLLRYPKKTMFVDN